VRPEQRPLRSSIESIGSESNAAAQSVSRRVSSLTESVAKLLRLEEEVLQKNAETLPVSDESSQPMMKEEAPAPFRFYQVAVLKGKFSEFEDEMSI